MKSMSIKQIIGALILIVGVVLIVMGVRHKESSGFERIKNTVTRDHSYTPRSTKFLMSGIAFAIVGGVMVFYCRCKKKK